MNCPVIQAKEITSKFATLDTDNIHAVVYNASNVEEGSKSDDPRYLHYIKQHVRCLYSIGIFETK